MATITSGTQLTMQNNSYGILSEQGLTPEVRATPAPTTTRITNSINNGATLVVYDGSFDPTLFDSTFQDNTAGIFAITGYQEYLATDTTNANGLRISGWTAETFNSFGSPNFDTLYGGADSISASASDDMIRGYDGADTLQGNAGNDTVIGGQTISDSADGGNALYGGTGADSIYGGGSTDVIYGGRAIADADDGNDYIEGYLGVDTIYGNTGNDTIYGEWATGESTDFQNGELIYGGRGSDVISGQGGNDRLAGGGGLAHAADEADTISGGSGNDTIVGNGGNDYITGDAGADWLFGGIGNDTMLGGDGNDTLAGQIGDETLSGGAGSDSFYFSPLDGNNTVLDFDAGTVSTAVDILYLSPSLVSSYTALMSLANTTIIPGDTVFFFSDGTIVRLEGVTALGSEDVAFTASSTYFASVVASGI